MQAITFLLDAVASFFCTLFLLRFMMQAMRVSFAGQIGDFVVKLTNWAIKPLRRFIPGLGGFDWASLLAALGVQLALSGILLGLAGPSINTDGGTLALMVLWFAIRALLRLAVYIFIGALILQAVLSWINPYSPLTAPAYQLTRPILDPIRRIVDRIGENCEPSLASVLFLGGAGGSLRAGVTENPVLLTRSIKNALVNVTCGGAPAYVWPGGGITVMADVLRMPDNSFGTVPTPAIVAPIEFSMRRADYEALGGHTEQVRSLRDVLERGAWHNDGAPQARVWQTLPAANPWPLGRPPLLG